MVDRRDPPTRTGGTGRRDLLRGIAAAGLGAGAGLSAGVVAARSTPDDAASDENAPAAEDAATPRGASVPAHGRHQGGIARPATPQAHGLLIVLDLPGVPEPGTARAEFASRLREILARLGAAITSVTSGDSASQAGLPDGAGDLTVTVGLGPRVVAALDTALPGAEDLPAFAGDGSVPPGRTGGDVVLALHSSDPNDVRRAGSWLAGRLPDARVRWSQRCFRAPGSGTVARNPLGFHDGIMVPRTEAELDDNVWIPAGPMAGGTICVIRRLRLDVAAFGGEPLAHQEGVVGRRLGDGSPLSGGGLPDEVDLLAKSPEGHYLTPAGSHVRSAHPSFTGSRLMLRRGYAFDDGVTDEQPPVADAGLLFVCFQRDLRTFVQTQHRLDENDLLMRYVRVTASATFLILPGFEPGRPLGATLA